MTKNIVFCADGTWNAPGQDEDKDGKADPTNVYKLFQLLRGSLNAECSPSDHEQEKKYDSGDGRVQVAKYIHGVGDSGNPIMSVLGGAFGAGLVARIVRGYTFISRNYESNADIHIVGFSRGAYTARALAGMILSQGLLSKEAAADRQQAYRLGMQVWMDYKKKCDTRFTVEDVLDIVPKLQELLSFRHLRDSDKIKVETIASVAVWDTVGALGIPDYGKGGRRTDKFKFANNVLSERVRHGFQALALDEQRQDFTPSLWRPAPNVNQRLFPGAHADVGGGYPVAENQSGLSDLALHWMLDRLAEVGVDLDRDQGVGIRPDVRGVAHKPWTHSPWNVKGIKLGKRKFPAEIPQDESIGQRMQCEAVVSEPGEPAAPYQPVNLPA